REAAGADAAATSGRARAASASESGAGHAAETGRSTGVAAAAAASAARLQTRLLLAGLAHALLEAVAARSAIRRFRTTARRRSAASERRATRSIVGATPNEPDQKAACDEPRHARSARMK